MDTLFTLSSSSSTFLFPTPRTKLSLTKTPTHLRNPVRLAVIALSPPPPPPPPPHCNATRRSLLRFKPSGSGFTLTLEISGSDPFYEDKLDIAETNGLGATAYFDIFLESSLPPALIPYLRLVALGGTDAFLLESVFRNDIWDHLQLPVSPANEELICRVVQDACKSALSGYTTTMEEDEKLKESKLDPRLEIAVGIRQGAKKVLQHIDGIFKGRESELPQLEYYQEGRLKDLGLCENSVEG